MTALIVVALSVLLIAGLVGYRNPTSGKWKYIDTLHDPMTVIGIVLLFLLNSSQRRQLVFIQEQSQIQQQREALLSKKPDLNARMSDVLLGSSFKYFEESLNLANACYQSASLLPMCDVAKKLAPSYAEFLKERDKPAADIALRMRIS